MFGASCKGSSDRRCIDSHCIQVHALVLCAHTDLSQLMQVDRLQSAGVAALAVTSLTPKEEVNDLYKQIESDKSLKLLYGTHVDIDR